MGNREKIHRKKPDRIYVTQETHECLVHAILEIHQAQNALPNSTGSLLKYYKATIFSELPNLNEISDDSCNAKFSMRQGLGQRSHVCSRQAAQCCLCAGFKEIFLCRVKLTE